MSFKFKNQKYEVELEIEDYEFDSDVKDYYDLNWLVVKVIFKNRLTGKIIEKKDACILTYELLGIKKWISSSKKELVFMEPCIELHKYGDSITIELCYELSPENEECIDFKCRVNSNKKLLMFKEETEKYIEKYPVRNIKGV